MAIFIHVGNCLITVSKKRKKIAINVLARGCKLSEVQKSTFKKKLCASIIYQLGIFSKMPNQLRKSMNLVLTISKLPNQLRLLVYTYMQAFSIDWVWKYTQSIENACIYL